MATEAAKLARFSVEQFERMGRVGIFRPDDRLELIDGEIYQMPPIGPGHAWCVDRLTALLSERLAQQAIVRVQNPAVLDERTEPQPDLQVLRGPADRYREAHPRPADVLLLIEVSDTTIRFDRGVKLPNYARNGVTEVWIVDLQAGRVEVFRKPRGDRYESVESVERGQAASPAVFSDVVVAVNDFLP